MKSEINHPYGWVPTSGYANGMMITDGTLHLGSQIGWHSDYEFVTKDLIGQTERIFTKHCGQQVLRPRMLVVLLGS